MQALVVPNVKSRALTQLTWTERPVPTPGPNAVLIKVQAVGLNPVDYKVVEGGVAAWQYPHTVGLDVAGTVVSVGANVTAFVPAQRVAGHCDLAENGTFAEYVVVPAAALAVIPETVSFETAAGSLCAGLTAYQALYRKVNLTAAETVLIHAGAGGVGSMAIQLAKAAGKQVFTTVSAHKQAFVAALQPDAQIDYRQEDVTARLHTLTAGQGVDVIVNTIGHPEADLPRLAYNGQLVCVLDTPKQVPADQVISVSKLDLGGAHRSGDARQVADLGRMLRELLALVAAGKVDPLISQVLPASDIVAGLQQIKADQVVGKLVARF